MGTLAIYYSLSCRLGVRSNSGRVRKPTFFQATVITTNAVGNERLRHCIDAHALINVKSYTQSYCMFREILLLAFLAAL